MEIGDEFMIHKAHCRYLGRRAAYADGSGPEVDLLEVVGLIAPSTGESIRVAYNPGSWEHRAKPIPESDLIAFIDTIPESVLPHLTEKEIEEEYIHHYGKP